MKLAAQLMINPFERALFDLQSLRQVEGREVIEIERQRRFAIRAD
jgi:hypothetical protein